MKASSVIAGALFVAAVLSCLSAQPEQPARSRDLWNSAFSKARPSRSGTGGAAVRTEVRPAEALVGLTIWRLRPASPADAPGVKILVHEPERTREFTPERVGVGTPLGEGSRVRLSIESARSGYLYVISYEKYADGSRGDPYLIFPTERIRGGDNQVHPGRVVGIPAWDDRPPYLTLRRSRPEHIAEVLMVLIAPKPLPGLPLERNATKLGAQQLGDWERRWGAPADMLDTAGGTGTPITGVESEAAAGMQLLHSDDPLPQTLYRVKVRPASPFLITTDLKVIP